MWDVVSQMTGDTGEAESVNSEVATFVLWVPQRITTSRQHDLQSNVRPSSRYMPDDEKAGGEAKFGR